MDRTLALDIHENPFKKDFPLLVGKPELVYLDSTATAQRPACVLDAEREFYETMNANALRGLYKLSVEATEAIERSRAHVAAHIGASNPEGVVFTRNTSESLNLVAYSLGGSILGPDDEVVITIMEHHSNLIPWQQVCARTGAKIRFLRPEKDGTITPEQIEAAITERARIVSVVHVSNVFGIETPVRVIADRAHAMGAYVVLDAAQSVPHLHVDVEELGCDLLAFSAHKMGGPMGIGVLWGKSEVLTAMPPFLPGGEMISSVTETGATWAPIPEKFEAGTQNAAGSFALDAAISYVEGIGIDIIVERERALASYLVERLRELPYVEIYGPADGAKHVGAVAFNVEGIHPHDVSSLLDMKEIAIRAGHHCAQPLLTWLGVESTCRASVAFYNDASDIDALIDGLGFVWRTFHGDR
ncbi:MAG: SufS family cysteine desulfurase [Atopobiaceae bacterium]|nr:SufS family cysteine desulfurase [Atopobiaceae bacterium]